MNASAGGGALDVPADGVVRIGHHVDDVTVTVIGPEPRSTGVNRETLPVTGMSCDGCEQNVENALKTIEGVTRVDADHESDTVEVVVDEDVADDDLHAAIEQAGYDVAA